MWWKRSTSNQKNENTDSEPIDPDKADKRRGTVLLVIFVSLLVLWGGIYIWAHFYWSVGPFAAEATKNALILVANAKTALNADKEDILDGEVILNLKKQSGELGLLGSQIGASTFYSDTLTKINAELANNQNRAVLSQLFDQLENIIRFGDGNYFWTGSTDRWLEMVFWVVIGTIVFLISEIKKYSSQNYKDKRDFTKFTPWYVANFFRGPFIALVISLGLFSISFEVIGISIDLQKASIEVWVVVAAILGYYSRVADKQLDIIAEYILTTAWKKANPDDKKDENASQSTVIPEKASPTDTKQPKTASPFEPPKRKYAEDIAYVHGIDPDFAQKLKDAGIFKPKDLVKRGATSQSREQIAKITATSREHILKWVNRCDFFRIPGVNPEYADLLQAVGVAAVVDLSKHDPENLYLRMVDANADKNRVRLVLVQSQVEDWVSQAQQLPQVVAQ